MTVLASIAALRTAIDAAITTNGTGDITGAVLNDELNDLIDTLEAKLVTTFNTRAGAVVPAASDYNASEIDNDSGVTGAFVDDALDTNAAAMALADGTRAITGSQTFNANVIVSGQAYSSMNTLSDGATIATDCDNGNVHEVTLDGNRTLGAPSNLKDGATYIWVITQDGVTGSRTLAYNAVFKFPGSTAPTLSTGVGDIDILTGISDGTNIYCTMQNDMS